MNELREFYIMMKRDNIPIISAIALLDNGNNVSFRKGQIALFYSFEIVESYCASDTFVR